MESVQLHSYRSLLKFKALRNNKYTIRYNIPRLAPLNSQLNGATRGTNRINSQHNY